MKTDNKNSEKDLNANPDSSLNQHRTADESRRFPESMHAKDQVRRDDRNKEKDDDIELLANEVKGTVSDRNTSSSLEDTAGVSDLDRGMRRGRRYKS